MSDVLVPGLFFLLFAAVVAENNTDASIQIKHHFVPRHIDKKFPGNKRFVEDYYWTEVVIPVGKQFLVRCPRDEPYDHPIQRHRYLVGMIDGRYSSNFTTYGSPGCPDLWTNNLQQLGIGRDCWQESNCTVSTRDPSTDPWCSKRPLMLRFRCLDASSIKAILVTTIIE
ncbi:uncharacterized protein LOC129589706 [Paramacrobiotus metropolitanus]|uniref:uncharacterized protein LOC129589706 n=1 Tax=Paramacrobiotus metropolitanus TaxID=2943436 RepID=UPI002445F36D|nr:uncharacterized protein LOC129589706 [Paramacrobiotus metropolitanus]